MFTDGTQTATGSSRADRAAGLLPTNPACPRGPTGPSHNPSLTERLGEKRVSRRVEVAAVAELPHQGALIFQVLLL